MSVSRRPVERRAAGRPAGQSSKPTLRPELLLAAVRPNERGETRFPLAVFVLDASLSLSPFLLCKILSRRFPNEVASVSC